MQDNKCVGDLDWAICVSRQIGRKGDEHAAFRPERSTTSTAFAVYFPDHQCTTNSETSARKDQTANATESSELPTSETSLIPKYDATEYNHSTTSRDTIQTSDNYAPE